MLEYISIKPPKVQRDWRYKKVRSLRSITTGVVVIPAGRIGTITNVAAGILHIDFDACECCGVKPRFTEKVRHMGGVLELVEPKTVVPDGA